MNKYMTLLFIMVFLVLVTIIAQELTLVSNSDVLGNQFTNPERGFEYIMNTFSFYFKVMTFNVPSIPNFINLLVFYPISLVILFYVIDVIKDIIPFT